MAHHLILGNKCGLVCANCGACKCGGKNEPLSEEAKDIIRPEWEKTMQFLHLCKNCGKEADLMVAFTQFQVCGDCVRKAHKGLTKP